MTTRVFIKYSGVILAAGVFLLLRVSIVHADPYPDFEAITAKTRSAVVSILTQSKASPSRFENDEEMQKFLWPTGKTDHSSRPVRGAGFFVSSDGYIVTEQSVVQQADSVIVKLDSGKRYPAKVIGVDDMTSVAVIKIDGKGFPVVKIGDGYQLNPGQWVMAMGSPFSFENVVTVGVVSALNKPIKDVPAVGFIMNNVTINPGNGGGPLINGRGEVVGMNAYIYSMTGQFSGLSFAVPINDVMPVVEQIKMHGKVRYGWLGVMMNDIALAEGQDEVVVVVQIEKNSPAGDAGVQVGDVITSFDGIRISNSRELAIAVRRTPIGKRVTLKLTRANVERSLSVLLKQRPDTLPAVIHEQ